MTVTLDRTFILIIISLYLCACSQEAAKFADVDADRLLNAAATPEEWLTYGGTYDEQRHSRLKQINTGNVNQLGVAWTYDLATARGVESTPIVVDGVMYVTSAWSVVHALDARTGEELWVYDPKVDRAVGVKACCDVVNRGVAVWQGNIYLGVIDGRLEALNAATGELVWSTITVDQSKPYTITGAPRVVKGNVLIGNGGAELGVRGYLSAYSADQGELVWRFYTVPNPNKQPDNAISDAALQNIGNLTWGDEGAWTTDGGGGTVWDSIVYDEVNDNIIFGVGNGSPWNRDVRDSGSGDNLFLSSIVAVDASTGIYKWHFQTTPGDNWDYTATQTIILADLPLGEDGAARRVAMQAPKNGFFYVLDAASGDFISGKAFVPQTWTEGLDGNGRPIEKPEARYTSTPFLASPGALGAHNWHPMAFNPDLGLAYIPAQEVPIIYAADTMFNERLQPWNLGINMIAEAPLELDLATAKAMRAMLKGRLIAWDPSNQTPRWTVEHSNAWNGGVLSTAGGIVFQGRLEGEFAAYNAATGEKLWSRDVKSGAASGPGTYAIDGEQYVTITTGWGSAFGLSNGYAYDQTVAPVVGKVVTFKLNGDGIIPEPNIVIKPKTPQAAQFASIETVQTGFELYHYNCMGCHGPFAISSGVLPDLRWSETTADTSAWKAIVLDGVLAANGMVSFNKYLSESDAEAIRAYVVKQAHEGAAFETEAAALTATDAATM